MGNWELVVGLCVSLLRARNGHHGAFGRRYLSFSLLLSSPFSFAYSDKCVGRGRRSRRRGVRGKEKKRRGIFFGRGDGEGRPVLISLSCLISISFFRDVPSLPFFF